jgi:hypothetical protein
VWWFTPITPAFGRLRQECKFETTLGKVRPVSKQTNTKKYHCASVRNENEIDHVLKKHKKPFQTVYGFLIFKKCVVKCGFRKTFLSLKTNN